MARYIDADELLKELQEELDFETPMYTEEQNKYFNSGLRCAIRDVKKSPTADVVPKSEVENINPIQEAIEQKKKENKGFALGVLNELLDEKDAEIKRLEYTLTGIMHSVDKWLEGEELKQDEINRAITMREKTLRIIEDAKSEVERLRFNLEAVLEEIPETKREVAREIFEEIEGNMVNLHFLTGNIELNLAYYLELKKKYTESEDKE